MDVNIGLEFLDLERIFAQQAIKDNATIVSSEKTISTFKSSNHSETDQLLDQVR